MNRTAARLGYPHSLSRELARVVVRVLRRPLFCGLLYAFLSVCLIGTATAAVIHPGLESRILEGRPDDSISVLVFLPEAPIEEVSADLSRTQSTRQQRNRVIVETLQRQQESTQSALKRWLDERMRDGSVFGYTSYWIANCVVVHGTVESVLEMSAREDLVGIEPNWRPELIEPVAMPMESGGGDRDPELPTTPSFRRGGGRATMGIRAIGADRVWAEFCMTGAGRIVANMDTGVDGSHPALGSRWRGVHHPASESWLDLLGQSPDFPEDNHGHGTHVMGTLTGLSPMTLDTVGVAWGAEWIATNALQQQSGFEFDNDILTSFQFFMNPDGDPTTFDDVPDVVQNSWRVNESLGDYSDCDTRWWNAIENCEDAGVVVVFSAGNEGPGFQTMGSPADKASTPTDAFSVGAIDVSRTFWPYPIADFSSRGPSGCLVSEDLQIKPEIVAPGVNVYSTIPGGGFVGGWNGTSMAGPHVAGVVALMREADPNLSVVEIKEILLETARDLGDPGDDNVYGAGMVDAYAAVERVVIDFAELEVFVGNASYEEAPIAGATVHVVQEDRSFVTGEDGTFRVLLPPGVYNLVASHPSFDTAETGVELEPGGSSDRRILLQDNAGPTIDAVSSWVSTSDVVGPYAISAEIVDGSTVAEAELFYRVDEEAWESVPMSEVEGQVYTGLVPGQPSGSVVDFYVRAADGIGFESVEPPGAPAEFHTFFVTELVYATDVESETPEWTLGTEEDAATAGIWERADPNGTFYANEFVQMEDDHTEDPGSFCFVTGNSPAGSEPGENDVDAGCTTLVSPTFDLANAEAAFVRYARWFMLAGATFGDVFAIEVTNDGGANWMELETVEDYKPEWVEASFEVSGLLKLTSQVQFRFVACDEAAPGLVECGIDDFVVESFAALSSDLETDPDPAGTLVDRLEVGLPNPMQDRTTLRFRLSNAGETRLDLYDTSGRRVRQLFDGYLTAGRHEVEWDGRDDQGRDVAAGVYFYRLRSGAFEQGRRLQVLPQ